MGRCGTSSGTSTAGASAPVPPRSAAKAPRARRSGDARDVRVERRGGQYCAGERVLLGFGLGFLGFVCFSLGLFGFVWFCLFGVFVLPPPPECVVFHWLEETGRTQNKWRSVLQKMCITIKACTIGWF